MSLKFYFVTACCTFIGCSASTCSGAASSAALSEAKRCISVEPHRDTTTMENGYGDRRSYSGDGTTVSFVCGARPGYDHLRVKLNLGVIKEGVCKIAEGDNFVSANFVLVVSGYDNLRDVEQSGYFDCVYSVSQWQPDNDGSVW